MKSWKVKFSNTNCFWPSRKSKVKVKSEPSATFGEMSSLKAVLGAQKWSEMPLGKATYTLKMNNYSYKVLYISCHNYSCMHNAMNMYTEEKFSLHNHVCLGLTFLDLHYIRLTEGVPNQLLFHYENSVWKIWCMPCMCNDLHGNIHALHSVIKMMNNVNQNVYTRWADNHWTHDIYIKYRVCI